MLHVSVCEGQLYRLRLGCQLIFRSGSELVADNELLCVAEADRPQFGTIKVHFLQCLASIRF